MPTANAEGYSILSKWLQEGEGAASRGYPASPVPRRQRKKCARAQAWAWTCVWTCAARATEDAAAAAAAALKTGRWLARYKTGHGNDTAGGWQPAAGTRGGIRHVYTQL